MNLKIIANFKSQKSTTQVKEWISKVDSDPTSKILNVVVAPAFTTFPLETPNHIDLAAQDCSPYPPGSYTGEVNARQLKEVGIKYCIIGHSERRKYLQESDQQVANKADLLLESNITPIICLDDPYIVSQIAKLPKSTRKNSLFAYEPSADIGGTEAAPLGKIKISMELIQSNLNSDKKIIYGGSVNSNNVHKLLDLDLEGFLVSTASLDSDNFIDILKSVISHGE